MGRTSWKAYLSRSPHERMRGRKNNHCSHSHSKPTPDGPHAPAPRHFLIFRASSLSCPHLLSRRKMKVKNKDWVWLYFKKVPDLSFPHFNSVITKYPTRPPIVPCSGSSGSIPWRGGQIFLWSKIFLAGLRIQFTWGRWIGEKTQFYKVHVETQ